jgi:maleylpyruvate isomerase
MTVALATRNWVDLSTRLILDGLSRLSDAELDLPCALPGWTRRHLLAHIASNAEAVGRLLTWARTGVETPMYVSLDQRAADIESGATRADLRDWVRSSAEDLSRSMDSMTADSWAAEVITVQGRTVPASETLWMRARETCLHAADLDVGVTTADLPELFHRALIDDVAAWRAAGPGPAILLTTPHSRHEIFGDGPITAVNLSEADAADWLTGRIHRLDLPALPRWL